MPRQRLLAEHSTGRNVSIDNTSDADKPVSTAQQTALDLKANVIEWTLTADGIDHYIFAGPGFAGTETDPPST